jgi:hypothetical protein
MGLLFIIFLGAIENLDLFYLCLFDESLIN